MYLLNCFTINNARSLIKNLNEYKQNMRDKMKFEQILDMSMLI